MAIDFENASSQSLTVPGNSIWYNQTDVSYALWIKPETVAGSFALMQRFAQTLFLENGDPKFIHTFSGTDGSWRVDANLAIGAVHHLVVTYNRGGGAGANPVIYIDGVSQTVIEDSTPTGGVDNDSSSITLGAGGGYSNYDGLMLDFRMFGRILVPSEAALLAAGRRGPIGGELLHLGMLTAQGLATIIGQTLVNGTNYVEDLSGYDGHANPVNSPVGADLPAPNMAMLVMA